MFKAPTVSLENAAFSYGQPKGSATFIKSNEALSRYVRVNFKVGGTMSARGILSVKKPYFKLPEDPDDSAGNVAFLKW